MKPARTYGGWETMPHDLWPDVAAALTTPWPESAAAHDLRWWAAERAVYGRKLPPVRELADRWGWTRWRAHDLLKADDRWADSARPRPWTENRPDSHRTRSGQTPDTANGSTPKVIAFPDTDRTDSGQEPDSRAIHMGNTPPSTQEGVDLAPPVPVVAPAPDLPSVLKGDTTLTAPLAAAGITTLDALTAQTPTAVQMLNRVGPKRLAAIVAHLAEAGLTLRAEPPKARKADIDRPGLRDLTDRWAGAYEHVTGRPYVWTPGGRRSDNKAARELYDALGWSAEPSEATVQRVRGVVSRYLRTRTTPGSHRVPTLADLAACLDQFAQDDHVVSTAHKPRPVQVTKADQEREMLGGLQALFTEGRHAVADS